MGRARAGGDLGDGGERGVVCVADLGLEHTLIDAELVCCRALARAWISRVAAKPPKRLRRETEIAGFVEETGFRPRLRRTAFDGDPIADIHNLARVATTIRAGQVIYQTP